MEERRDDSSNATVSDGYDALAEEGCRTTGCCSPDADAATTSSDSSNAGPTSSAGTLAFATVHPLALRERCDADYYETAAFENEWPGASIPTYYRRWARYSTR